jgi:hypothetical protein
MAEQRQQPEESRTGSSDHPQHRTPPGEGSEAAMSEGTGQPAEMSLYDGAGNETTSVLTEDAEGRPRQGTGETTEEAIQEARSGKPIGEAFNPPA